MRSSTSRFRRLPVLAAVLVAVGCKGPAGPTEPLKMWSIEFGTGVDAQNQVTGPTRTFTPTSPVYVSISTQGAGDGTVTVEWAAGSTIVSTEKHDISATKPEHFAFHYVPPDGWPKGLNHVRFSLNDGEKHVADFQVE